MMAATVVLLPGNMCDARLWRELSPGLFGNAQMVHADLTQDATIKAMATRALKSAAGALLPVGFSMGAIVAVEMAKLAPRRIAGLILSGFNATADLPERAARRPLQQAEAMAGGLERLLVEELKPIYLAACHRDNAGMLELLRDMGMSLGAEVFIRQSEALCNRADRRKTLTKLNIPMLFACGLEDQLCPPEWHRQWMAMVPGSRLAMVAGSGHMLPLEQPDAFAKAIGQWLIDNERKLKL
jgi:pimeloyl-ACP methyl ester carboxylesterase